MSTIPASAIVDVLPGVISAGGSALDINGMFVTNNARVPIGTAMPFGTAAAVSAFFGPASHEAALAAVYFAGFTNSDALPGTLYFTQYPKTAVAAYLRGGNISSLSLAQLQALSGSLDITMDGYAWSADSVNLASASSFSAAAALIQTAILDTDPEEAAFTGAIGASFTGSGSSTNLTISSVTGLVSVGDIVAGAGVPSNTKIVSQTSGTPGGQGVYVTSQATTASSASLTTTSNVLDVSAVSMGTLSIGQTLSGSGVTASTVIVGLGTGTGETGTYIVNNVQAVASESMEGVATPFTVSYDSVSGAFVFTSGITGTPSTAAFATGTIAASLLLTSATGAVLSQGAAAATPGTFMSALVGVTQNWATFLTTFDPDGGSGNAQKLLFAQWVSGQNNRYCYVCWDTDASPTTQVPATSSLGYLLAQQNLSGTCLIYEPSDQYIADFVCGAAASIDFTETNGRTTFAFLSQAGLVAGVTSQQVMDNLIANGYNFYGAYASANSDWVFFYPGSVSGEFQWLDSFINEIWLNAALQVAMMNLLTSIKSIPYNSAGYSLIEAACQDPIIDAVNFGAIRAGVTLSAAQIAEVNNEAGANIATTLQTQGWYLQIQDAQPSVRQARQSPPCKLWYVDGQSVQQITLSSILVQ